MFFRVFLTLTLFLKCFGNTHITTEDCPDGQQHYRVGIRHIESGGIGYEDGYTTFEAFLSSDPSQWSVIPFFDAKGHIFDNGKWAANAGIGLRSLFGNRVYGINTYYDYRNANHFHSNQIGIGLETLGELFDFRINGYLPVGAKISHPYDTTFKNFSGHYMQISQKYLSAMKGADAEFGFHFGKSKLFDFYAAAGPYYFIGHVDPCTWGGKGRISGTFKDILTLEISDSYDKTFHNKFQGKISLSFALGPKSKVKAHGSTCKTATTLNHRMLQPVDRQEIIVIDHAKKTSVAIDPATGLPYFFVFVNNTSSSSGTYESPYHSLAQAETNSSPNDIIYVFPGDGTTRGMNSGIALKANQKFWGSAINHTIQTSAGVISIPAQSSTTPQIANTNVDTEGNALTLANNNEISGISFTSAIQNAIYGDNPQTLDVSFCTFEDIGLYTTNAAFSGDADITLTNNQFLNNSNGIFLDLHGTSHVTCSNNIFQGQTSPSSIPLTIAATSNTITTQIENNTFHANRTGSILFALNNVVNADLTLLNNTMTNNTTGSVERLGSSVVIEASGTVSHCSIVLQDNLFSNNKLDANHGATSFYTHTSGQFTTFEMTASGNTMSNNVGAGITLATPVNTLRFVARNNVITGNKDNGIAMLAAGLTSTGNITIGNNTITDIGGGANGIAVSQDFSNLNLNILNNEIRRCSGTGVLTYSSTGIQSFTLNLSENLITNCQNIYSNAAAGVSIEQYTNLIASITNNTLSDNATPPFLISSILAAPNVCLTLTGNSNSGTYSLGNPPGGTFKLSPCNVNSVNVGTISLEGTITPVQSCPGGTPCSS
ncbi:MAG: right-handed parallel beta-helix repeat-containing protein [Simkaniaceae bacterium]|nr:right-handed parallel beta-helix repeat-containing protein [Simkaniaceae bacterium]